MSKEFYTTIAFIFLVWLFLFLVIVFTGCTHTIEVHISGGTTSYIVPTGNIL